MRILLLLLLAGCANQLIGEAMRPIGEQGEMLVIFCPEQDCEGILASLLEQSTEAACAFYDLDLPSVEKVASSEAVELLIFKEEHTGIGTPVAATAGGLMHHKLPL